MMIPVTLSKIIINEKDREQVILLREQDGCRQIPILIGFTEATSIQMFIVGTKLPRPMTHDFFADMIKTLGGEVAALSITDVVDGTFYASLRVKNAQGAFVDVDCRPSDGVALAVRLNVPIFVREAVFVKISGAGD